MFSIVRPLTRQTYTQTDAIERNTTTLNEQEVYRTFATAEFLLCIQLLSCAPAMKQAIITVTNISM